MADAVIEANQGAEGIVSAEGTADASQEAAAEETADAPVVEAADAQ